MVPVFLQLGEVVQIHDDQIARYGGAPGMRDPGLLSSAVAAPRAGTEEGYLHADLFQMAAAYLFHIVRDHPFVDGNKRTGVVAAIVFLRMNDLRLEADQDDLEALVRRVASGSAGRDEVSHFFRCNTRRA